MPDDITKVTLKVPNEIHRKVAVWAKGQRRSMHSALLQLLDDTVAKVELSKVVLMPVQTVTPAARVHAPLPQRQARPIVMTLAQAQEFLTDVHRFKDSDKLYAARVCVGDTDTEALAFMRRQFDPIALVDPFDAPVTQPAWAAVRDALRSAAESDGGQEDEFVFDPNIAYAERRAEGLSHAQAVERVEWSCECNGVTGWVPPQNEEPV